jgi:hypothetical protein
MLHLKGLRRALVLQTKRAAEGGPPRRQRDGPNRPQRRGPHGRLPATVAVLMWRS